MPGPLARRRHRREQQEAVTRHRHPVRHSLKASAQKQPLNDKRAAAATASRRQEWQDEAWQYFDDVPEIKYSVWYEGNVISKARWFPAVVNVDDPEADPMPVTDPEASVDASLVAAAQAELLRLRGPLGGLSEIVRELNMNLEIAAEAYLVGFGARTIVTRDPTSGEDVQTEVPEEWDVKSVSEVEQAGGTYKIRNGPQDQKPRTLDAEFDTIIRIWQRHPRWSMLPDCNMRGVLSECEALVLLSNQVKAEAKSHMNAGFLLIPNGMSFGPDGSGDDSALEGESDEDAGTDPFLQEMYDGIVDPIEDPSSAAAVAPTMLRGPVEELKEFRHVSISRDNSTVLEARIQARVERVARGLNLPVESVMGHQQTTYANAAQVTEDEYTKHFQPRLVLIADALTIGFLQPNLLDALPNRADDIARIVIWFDPSDLLKQTDPAETATDGLNADVISEEAWRRVNGWSEDDAPDPVERLIRTVLHLRTYDPGISTAILELLGVPLNIPDALPGTTSTNGATPSAASRAQPSDALLRAMIGAAPRELVAEIGTTLNGDEPERASQTIAAAATTLPLVALRAASKARTNPGTTLMLLDRELRTRLLEASSAAMSRVLERAGNRLRSKVAAANKAQRQACRDVDALHVGSVLGRALVAAAGVNDADLIGADAWSALHVQWDAWVTDVQAKALNVVSAVVRVSPAHRRDIETAQAVARDDGWTYFADQLGALAADRIFGGPDISTPVLGESDATSTVPVGLVRSAMARAGGASNLQTVDRTPAHLRAAVGPNGETVGGPGSVFVEVNGGDPPGGVATGEQMSSTLEGGGAGIEGYVWVYGPAFRKSEFEPHQVLDGIPFVNFDDDVLATANSESSVDGTWIGDYFFPGDHDGCCCDVEPTIVDPLDLADSLDFSNPDAITEADQLPETQPTPDEPPSPAQRIMDATANLASVSPRPAEVIGLDVLSDEHQVLLAERIEAFARDYPSAAQRIQTVEVSDMRHLRFNGGGKADTAMAGVARTRFGMSHFYVNSTWFDPANADKLAASLAKSALPRSVMVTNAEGFRDLIPTTWAAVNTPQGIFDHELGHVLDNGYNITSLYGTDLATWTARENTAKLSEYAMTNKLETFAELFSLRQEVGLDGLMARAPEIAQVWIDTAAQLGLKASAADGTGDAMQLVDAPWFPPDIIEALKADGMWPFD